MGSHSLSFGERVFYRFPSDQLIMLYPLLKWDTSFPAGFSGETVDLLLKDASSRTLRARTEDTTRNFRHHEILQSELDHLRPRTWVAERQRIDDSRRAARGFSVNKLEINRPDRRIEYKSWISCVFRQISLFFGKNKVSSGNPENSQRVSFISHRIYILPHRKVVKLSYVGEV